MELLLLGEDERRYLPLKTAAVLLVAAAALGAGVVALFDRQQGGAQTVVVSVPREPVPGGAAAGGDAEPDLEAVPSAPCRLALHAGDLMRREAQRLDAVVSTSATDAARVEEVQRALTAAMTSYRDARAACGG